MIDERQLRRCYDILRRAASMDLEPFEIVRTVEQYRQFWRPKKVTVILLAESHVWTTLEEWRVEVENEQFGLPSGPDRFVRFVYCLGYGESGVLASEVPNNSGTPQFWKLFHGCLHPVKQNADFGPVTKGGTPNLHERIGNKLELLEAMRRQGVWLVDASIAGLYTPGGGKPTITECETVLQKSWDHYVGPVVRGAGPRHIICIGQMVANALGERLKEPGLPDVTVLPAPQAFVSKNEIMANFGTGFELVQKFGDCGGGDRSGGDTGGASVPLADTPALAPSGEDAPAEMHSLGDLARQLRAFVAARDWSKFHSPKNLAMALAGEAGELAAEFQWLTQAESADLSPEKLEQVRLEMADVLIYLVRLADELDIDVLKAASDKMAINDGRYPADLVKGKAAKYSEYDKPDQTSQEDDEATEP